MSAEDKPDDDFLSRGDLLERGALATAGLAAGAMLDPAAAGAAEISGPADFSTAFGTVVGFTDTRVRLPAGEIETNAATRVIVDEVSLAADDRGIATRGDRIRFADQIYAVGTRQADGSVLARTVWSGVLAFPVRCLAPLGPSSYKCLTHQR